MILGRLEIMAWKKKYGRGHIEDDEDGKYFICFDFDLSSGKTGKSYLVMTEVTASKGNWGGGRKISIDGKEFVLGEHQTTNGVLSWELVRVSLPPLSIDE